MSVRSEGFPTPEAAKLTGVSIGKLDAWCRRNILKPSVAAAKGHGISRVWSFADLVAMRVLEDVHEAGGLSRTRLANAIRYVRKRRALTEMSANTWLVIRGADVFEFELNADGRVPIAEFEESSPTVLTLVRVGLVVQQLLEAARALRAA